MSGSDYAEIWATFSTFDHLKPGAFLPEVVMYDRLVIPIPPADDADEWRRWEEDQKWNPARQRNLIAALGDVVKPVEWTQLRRDTWQRDYKEQRSSAGRYLRQTLAGQLTAMG